MPLPIRKFRELVFQILYSSDFTENEDKDLISYLMHIQKVTRKSVALAHVAAERIKSEISTIDKLIAEASEEYSFQRIPKVERNILRLSVYELLFDKTIPEKVAIAEALRLSKKFSTPQSVLYINAIMDKIYKENPLQHK